MLWPGNKNMPNFSDGDIRKNAIVIQMAGAALNVADMNGDSSSGFSGSMNPADRVHRVHDIVKKVWDFFAPLPFHTMKPSRNEAWPPSASGLEPVNPIEWLDGHLLD